MTDEQDGTAATSGAEPGAETEANRDSDFDLLHAAVDAEAEEINEGEHLEDDELRAALEAVLLVVDTPATVEELATALGQERRRVRKTLRTMSADLTAAGSGIDLRFAGDGWRFYTRSEYAPYVEKLLLDGTRSKLTRAALETLAVVAYRQPVTRARVSAIRGVNVDGVVRTLLARGLISDAGNDETTNGTLYVTTELFLERLGLASLGDLPDIAPLLPGVDAIDDLGDELLDDPRFAKLAGGQAQSEVDVSAKMLAEADEG
ncbi:SMC-Scp complex subunit ScpB [Gordonia sp. (in: high G+C Gram-positive bacteria)]|uniref:SMC-Scp complex subunit ScpB n=1 Tax=Gordonia sp. (in: high G+C Gram-positive bacteria) TaxID=84139 RepID=UPI0025B896E3|nr:SMC-Scp complex subunit ScpB [Gordonia sp. (in: high G+C Gram-positive bacteria)]